MESALPDLPDDVDQYKHRPTKLSVYAILARTYLYMGNYTKALENANSALQIRNYLYDYNTIYTGTVDYYNNLIGISRMNDEEMILWKTFAKSVVYTTASTHYILDTMTFNQLYPDFIKNPDGTTVNYDLRRTLKFNGIASNRKMTATSTFQFNFYNQRYKTDSNKGGTTCHNPVATPEMYLTRAECNARAGNLQAALDDVNAICSKRYKTGSFTNLTPANFQNNKDLVLDRVLLERRRELYGKDMRLYDLKRLNLPFTHKLGSLTISVPANDPRLIWPIFPKYIEMNSELEQNERETSGVKYYDKNGVEVPITD
ncbi:MAG: RagB/SusD family nutrient uptake outer membrane protein [Bacteroidales bacterium]|nr:RagB/SusD family nutrient uptake outer membrane protein [Bacteroidales bacterium]